MKRLQVRERAFKRLSFASTLVGIVLIAVGLQRLLVGGSWIQLALFALPGVAIALVSVLLEVAPEPGFVITLYTRQGCSLCEVAKAFLVAKKAEYDYDLWEVDVDKDPKLVARYGDWVPVAILGRDEELFRLGPDFPRLEAHLRREADARVRR